MGKEGGEEVAREGRMEGGRERRSDNGGGGRRQTVDSELKAYELCFL